MNPGLFKRVKYLYDNRDKLGLADDQKLAVEKSYKDFTRNGALLSTEKQEELKKLNTELTDLYLQFNKTCWQPPTPSASLSMTPSVCQACPSRA